VSHAAHIARKLIAILAILLFFESVAHEIRQPLAAIAISGRAAPLQ
jgi:hypothetical protein